MASIPTDAVELAELCQKEWRLSDATTLDCIKICFPEHVTEVNAKELNRIVFQEDYETAPRLLYLQLVKLFGTHTENNSTYGLATAIVYWARREMAEPTEVAMPKMHVQRWAMHSRARRTPQMI